jgi:hypothetical protein
MRNIRSRRREGRAAQASTAGSGLVPIFAERDLEYAGLGTQVCDFLAQAFDSSESRGQSVQFILC